MLYRKFVDVLLLCVGCVSGLLVKRVQFEVGSVVQKPAPFLFFLNNFFRERNFVTSSFYPKTTFQPHLYGCCCNKYLVVIMNTKIWIFYKFLFKKWRTRECFVIKLSATLLLSRRAFPDYIFSLNIAFLKLAIGVKKSYVTMDRSSLPEVFLRKGVLKTCSKLTGEHSCRSVISIKFQSNFIEITLRHECSLINLLHILKTPFSKNTSGWLLLILRIK